VVIRRADHKIWQSVAVTRPVQPRGGNATRVRVPEPRASRDAGQQRAAAGQQRAATGQPQRGAEQQRVEQRYLEGGRRTNGQPLRAAWDPLAEHGQKVRSARGRTRPKRRRGLAGFLRYYGWRAYALPVLAVLTVLALLDAGHPAALPIGLDGGPAPSSAAPTSTVEQTAAPTTPLVPNPADNPKYAEAKAAELPAGGPFTERGTGTFAVLPGTTERIGTGQMFTYTIEIEDGVQLPGGPDGFAHTVEATLNNPKSWIGSGKYAFQRIDSGQPAIRITLVSQQTARAICGFKIQFDASCWRSGRTVINIARWERGAVAFQGNVVAYQQYLVNHEVGHGLGFSHKPCTENGALAPIMMQQTWGVSNDYLAALGTDNVPADGKVCTPNPWPYPTQDG